MDIEFVDKIVGEVQLPHPLVELVALAIPFHKAFSDGLESSSDLDFPFLDDIRHLKCVIVVLVDFRAYLDWSRRWQRAAKGILSSPRCGTRCSTDITG